MSDDIGVMLLKMFGFEDPTGGMGYDDRKVDRSEINGAKIDTAMVFDSGIPYETAVSHPDYNGDKWIIVQQYRSKEEAQQGHEKWTQVMSGDILPAKITDVMIGLDFKKVDRK